MYKDKQIATENKIIELEKAYNDYITISEKVCSAPRSPFMGWFTSGNSAEVNYIHNQFIESVQNTVAELAILLAEINSENREDCISYSQKVVDIMLVSDRITVKNQVRVYIVAIEHELINLIAYMGKEQLTRLKEHLLAECKTPRLMLPNHKKMYEAIEKAL